MKPPLLRQPPMMMMMAVAILSLAIIPAIVQAQSPGPPVPVFRDGPPAQRPLDDPGPPPGPGLFYIPGEFMPTGPNASLEWHKGFWTREQPGWTWLPAGWDRTSEGWSFREGRWIRDAGQNRAEDRAVVRTTLVPTTNFVSTGFVSPWISPLTYAPFNPVVSLGPLGPPGVIVGGPFPFAYGPAFGVGPWGMGGFGFGGFGGGFGGFGPWGFRRGFGGFW